MAHTLDTSKFFSGATNPVTTTYTCGSGTTLLVVLIVTAPVVVAGHTPMVDAAVTYNGIAMSLGTSGQADETSSALFFLQDPPTGSAYTISVGNEDSATLYIYAVSFKAAAGKHSGWLNTVYPSNGASATAGGTITAVPAGGLVVGACGGGYKLPPTGRSQTSLRENDDGVYSDNFQYGLIGTLGDIAVTWSFGGSDDWSVAAESFGEGDLPAAPSSLHVDSFTENSITIGWTDNAGEFEVFIYKDGVYQSYQDHSITTRTFSGLVQGQSYLFEVKAHSPYGYSAAGQLTALIHKRLILNVGDAWKEPSLTQMMINIGDVWKTILAVAVNVGDAWKGIFGPIGARGYFCGGYTTADVNTIDGFQFLDKTTFSLSAVLSVARSQLGGAGSSVKGYCAGGTGPSSDIDGLQYSDETAINPTAVLSYARYNTDGTNSSTKAYWGGGYGTAYSADVDGVQFSDDTAINPSGVLSLARQGVTCVTSSTYGFFAGGSNGTIQSLIDSIKFSDETVADCGADLWTAHMNTIGVNSSSYGYLCGGQAAGNSYTIDRILLSSYSVSQISAILSNHTSRGGGVNNATDGCIGGGDEGSTPYTKVDDLVFSSETCSALSAVLATGRKSMASITSGGFL